jgi:hypothetical protein
MRKADNFDPSKWLVENKITTQSRLNEDKTSLNITPQQKRAFTQEIKNFIADEDFDTAMQEAGNILASMLTNGEAEFIEDVSNFGYDPDQVEKYAQDITGNLYQIALSFSKPENYEEIIQQYIENGSKGSLILNNYDQPTLPNNLTKVGGDLSLFGSKITSLPDNLTVEGELYLYLPQSNMTSLPDNLKVNSNLNLYDTKITSIPNNLKVNGNLNLSQTSLSEKYSKEEIRKILTVDNKLANEALAGHMGAVAAASRNIKSPSGEEPSSSPDEFSLNILVNPLYKKYANYNYKLKDVEFEKPKVKEGFFSDMFSSNPTIKFIFTKADDGKEASIQVKLKGDKFVLNNSSTSGAVVATMPSGEQAKKFISYLLGQSQWKDELTKTFQNISSALTADSFK